MRLATSAKILANILRAAGSAICLLAANCAHAEGIDTEHIFGFMIGTDVGNVGERELQFASTGRFAKSSGHYGATSHELELEFVPVRNMRIELGGEFASYNISGVQGLADQRGSSLQGASVDFRYRFLERESFPLGLTVALTPYVDRIDETRGTKVRGYGTIITAAFDMELVPDISVAALNLIYQREWTRVPGAATSEQEASLGVSVGVMTKVGTDILVGAEARYLRKYDGIGLNELAGQVLFVGPTVYLQLSERSRLTASWSMQAWGRTAGSGGALDLVNFERHQARLVFGVNF